MINSSLVKIIITYLLSTTIMFIVAGEKNFKNPFLNLNFTYLKKYPTTNPGIYSDKILNLHILSKSIKPDSIVLIGNSECSTNEEMKNYSYSAVLEARIWNECHMYDRKTKGGMYSIVNMFKDINYDVKENPKLRYQLAYDFTFTNKFNKEKCETVIAENKWSYVLINSNAINKVGYCLDDTSYIIEDNYLLYKL
tara:strand:+ start:2326 stop:2910 length:585 start_codon:yes stop_codon:yes gene_type:complete